MSKKIGVSIRIIVLLIQQYNNMGQSCSFCGVNNSQGEDFVLVLYASHHDCTRICLECQYEALYRLSIWDTACIGILFLSLHSNNYYMYHYICQLLRCIRNLMNLLIHRIRLL